MRRARTTAIAGAAALTLVFGGFAGARSLSNDDLPPANPEPKESAFVGTWFSTDNMDGSNQTMVVRTSGEGAYEIEVSDDSAGVCSGAPSTMTGTGRLDDAGELVIPSPVFTCDDGSEPMVENGPTIEELLHNLTFVHEAHVRPLRERLGSGLRAHGTERDGLAEEKPGCRSGGIYRREDERSG